MTIPWVVAFASLSAVVVAIAFVLLGVLRRLLPALEGFESLLQIGGTPTALGVGSAAPEFLLRGTNGETVSTAGLFGSPWLIVFLSGRCSPCQELASALSEGFNQDELPARLIVAVNSAPEIASLGIPTSVTTVVQEGGALARDFASSVTPHGFAITRSGVVAGSSFPSTREALMALAQLAADQGKEVDTSSMRSRGSVGVS